MAVLVHHIVRMYLSTTAHPSAKKGSERSEIDLSHDRNKTIPHRPPAAHNSNQTTTNQRNHPTNTKITTTATINNNYLNNNREENVREVQSKTKIPPPHT